jgi:hypothetical protein
LTNVEAVRRWLAERGAVWTERWGPPPQGVYALRDMHPPSHAEEACRQGLPLVYIAAVDRNGLYYIFGDVAWTPQLEKICKAVTFIVEAEPLRESLNAIVKFVARTRHLPWVSFRPEVCASRASATRLELSVSRGKSGRRWWRRPSQKSRTRQRRPAAGARPQKPRRRAEGLRRARGRTARRLPTALSTSAALGMAAGRAPTALITSAARLGGYSTQRCAGIMGTGGRVEGRGAAWTQPRWPLC